jgi:hypothetical protein
MIPLFAGEGRVYITSNKSLACIRIDGEKKAMTGDRGVTMITLKEGEHTIQLIKPRDKKDKNSYSSALRTVLIGDESSINLSFYLEKIDAKQKR